jgi:hypothetical protein
VVSNDGIQVLKTNDMIMNPTQRHNRWQNSEVARECLYMVHECAYD